MVGGKHQPQGKIPLKARFIILVAVFYRDQQRGAGAYISRVQEKTKKHTRHAYAGKERIGQSEKKMKKALAETQGRKIFQLKWTILYKF